MPSRWVSFSAVSYTHLRAASLFVAAACLTLSVTVYPASAATSMSSRQNKLNKLSQSIEQHKKELLSLIHI